MTDSKNLVKIDMICMFFKYAKCCDTCFLPLFIQHLFLHYHFRRHFKHRSSLFCKVYKIFWVIFGYFSTNMKQIFTVIIYVCFYLVLYWYYSQKDKTLLSTAFGSKKMKNKMMYCSLQFLNLTWILETK